MDAIVFKSILLCECHCMENKLLCLAFIVRLGIDTGSNNGQNFIREISAFIIVTINTCKTPVCY